MLPLSPFVSSSSPLERIENKGDDSQNEKREIEFVENEVAIRQHRKTLIDDAVVNILEQRRTLDFRVRI